MAVSQNIIWSKGLFKGDSIWEEKKRYIGKNE